MSCSSVVVLRSQLQPSTEKVGTHLAKAQTDNIALGTVRGNSVDILYTFKGHQFPRKCVLFLERTDNTEYMELATSPLYPSHLISVWWYWYRVTLQAAVGIGWFLDIQSLLEGSYQDMETSEQMQINKAPHLANIDCSWKGCCNSPL